MTPHTSSVSAKLWNRDFTRLWWSEAISFFGSQLTLFAIPIVALQVLHATASEVAWITAAAGVGTLVMLGLGGPWTDRGRRSRFMALTAVLRAVVLIALASLMLSGHLSIAVLLVAAGLIAGLTGLSDSAFSALVPSVVDRSKLAASNSWVAGIRSAGDIGAGATAGILLQLLSPVALFVTDAVTYLVSAGALVRTSDPRLEQPEKLDFNTYAKSIAVGFRAVFVSRVMWPITLSIAHFNLFTAALQATYVTHAFRSGAMAPVELGLAGALGGVIGLSTMGIASAVWNWSRPVIVLTVTFALPAAAGCGMLFLSPGRPFANIMLLALSLGLWAASVMANISGTETLKQLVVPERSLGSFSAASRVLTWGVDPIGAALAAVLASALPTGVVVFISAAGVLTSAVWVLASRVVRVLPRLELVESRASSS